MSETERYIFDGKIYEDLFNIVGCVEIFQKAFGDKVIFYPQRRICKNYSEYLSEYKFDRENDEYHRGADYWIALKVLSKCNALIGGDCSGLQIARKLNDGKYEHTYILI